MTSLSEQFYFLEVVGNLNLSTKQILSLEVISVLTNILTPKTIIWISKYVREKDIVLGIKYGEAKHPYFVCTQRTEFNFTGIIHPKIEICTVGSSLESFVRN